MDPNVTTCMGTASKQQATASLAKVSAIVAAYNAESTIGETIASLLAQTHTRMEVIVCDDASTDSTCEIVENIRDDRVVLLRSERNRGPGASRDSAIARAAGEWIAFVDADDACHPARIERMLAAARGESDVIVFDNTVECHDTPRGLLPWRLMRGPSAFGEPDGRGTVDVTHSAWIMGKRMLIKPLISAEAIRRCGVVHGNARFAEDSEFILRLLAKGCRLRFLPEALYYYRITPGSLTTSRSRWDVAASVLRGVEPLFSGDQETLHALHRTLRRIQSLAQYQHLLDDLRDRKPGKALSRLVKQPVLLVELASRLARDARYNLHRAWRGGTRR
jgi:succinoglycan biosynthesis protein ExoO